MPAGRLKLAIAAGTAIAGGILSFAGLDAACARSTDSSARPALLPEDTVNAIDQGVVVPGATAPPFSGEDSDSVTVWAASGATQVAMKPIPINEKSRVVINPPRHSRCPG